MTNPLSYCCEWVMREGDGDNDVLGYSYAEELIVTPQTVITSGNEVCHLTPAPWHTATYACSVPLSCDLG